MKAPTLGGYAGTHNKQQPRHSADWFKSLL